MTPQPIFVFLYGVLAFLIGGIPFSVLIGRYVLQVDIRQFGDGNPGGTNVARAGGKVWGGVAVTLDAFKALIPVGIAYWLLDITGPGLVLIGLAGPLGHAYSPFLGFKGGKAIASIAGAWTGLIGFEAPAVMVSVILISYFLLDADGWSAVNMLIGLLLYLLVRNMIWADLLPLFAPTTVWFLLLWLGHLALIVWKHRGELTQLPRLRSRA